MALSNLSIKTLSTGITDQAPSGVHNMVAQIETEVVDFGGGKKITSNKRFTCATSDVEYLLHCGTCQESGSYAIHVGSINNIHNRTAQHMNSAASSKSTSKQKYTATEIQQFIANQANPDEFRRDSHVHFAYEHKLKGREVARITVLQTLSPADNRRIVEDKFKREFGAYTYKGLGRGGLNGIGG